MIQEVSRCYEEYKDSGIEWLGRTPIQWKITRNKDIFEERGSLSSSGNETLLTVSHITGVTRRTEKNVNMFMAETMEGYKLCKTGDFIINTMWAWMGALGTADEEGICSPAYGVYKPKKYKPYNHKYFDYLYRTPNAITEMTRNSKGIVSSRLRLYPKYFFQIKTALPPFPEQKFIADYLDTKTAQIDKKIDLLAQKAVHYSKLKQSLINETVLRGLDKTVAMKDSGVEWVGDIPKHWEVMRLKDVATMRTGNSLNDTLKEKFSDKTIENTPYVGTKDIDLATYSANINNGVYIPNSESKYKKSPSYSTLLCVEGGSAGKKMAFVKQSVCYVNKLLCFSNNVKVNSLFLHYFIRSTPFVSKFNTCLTGLKDNYWGVTGSQISRFKTLVPSLVEQKDIAYYLDTKTAKIDTIVGTINIQIDQLKELRKTLINDVVTGQIKVV